MSRQTFGLSEGVLEYIRDVTVHETDVERRCREETAERENANMQISSEQGQVMKWMVETLGVQRSIEVGTFTGYSALCVAGALPAGGELVACEIDEDYAETARSYLRRAGLSDRTEFRIGPALESLDAMIEEGEAGGFDFAFIDADKTNYVNYYERILKLVGVGGVLAFDNTLWSGSVADPDEDDDSTEAIRQLNATMAGDDRVTSALIPVGDGLSVAYRRR